MTNTAPRRSRKEHVALGCTVLGGIFLILAALTTAPGPSPRTIVFVSLTLAMWLTAIGLALTPSSQSDTSDHGPYGN